jgi:hypothetical protein
MGIILHNLQVIPILTTIHHIPIILKLNSHPKALITFLLIKYLLLRIPSLHYSKLKSLLLAPNLMCSNTMLTASNSSSLTLKRVTNPKTSITDKITNNNDSRTTQSYKDKTLRIPMNLKSGLTKEGGISQQSKSFMRSKKANYKKQN